MTESGILRKLFMETRALQESGDLLRSFLQATDESESQRLLEALVTEHARPIIRGVVSQKLRVSINQYSGSILSLEAEEVFSEALFRLVERLHVIKSSSGAIAISNFRGYVAAIAYNACYEYLRQKYPERSRLKNKIRYILTHQKGFTVWGSDDKELLCGLADWKDQKRSIVSLRSIQELRHSRQILDAVQSSDDVSDVEVLTHLLTTCFNSIENPVRLDDLVDFVADLYGVKDLPRLSRRDAEGDAVLEDYLPDPAVGPHTRVEQRAYIQNLWAEICQLSVEQRKALLLNLKDAQGRDLITLIAHIRIATLSQIAEVLDMSNEDFAALWNDLPLSDESIAQQLGIARQQVISLRQSARRKLTRRMRSWRESG
jgi:RNA polymerase sigma factor (sigma-70 family)